jgi:hypothetical protein
MEFVFSKIQKLLGSLKVALSFHDVLTVKKIETHIHIHNTFTEPQSAQSLITAIPDGAEQTVGVLPSTTAQLNLSQQYLVRKINELHLANGSNYDFTADYSWYLQHKTSKITGDWMVSAAVRLAQCIQYSNFFHSFPVPDDPRSAEKLKAYLQRISYLYRIIQEIRHTDKQGKLAQEFQTPYDRAMGTELNHETIDYEKKVFDEFEALLIEFFSFYEKINQQQP